MSYGVLPTTLAKHRYLIHHQGVWKYYDTWSLLPDWDDEVTDVIWLKNSNMIASWWQMKNGKRFIKRTPKQVTDEEMVFILLQVADV